MKVSALCVVLCMAGFASLAHAQETGIPAGWRWAPDRSGEAAAADSALRFDHMPPGWHITSGPAGLLYPPAERAAGLFSLVADFVVFPETTESGFGIFLGGAELEGEAATYLAALLRRDGAVSVVRRTGGAETVLVPWTTNAAIKPHPGEGVITNRLRVNASTDSLRVFVNDSSVARVPLGSAATDGHFGFRVGRRVNLHLTILDHIRHLAPARSR
ncbi:MAG TPA: hypothetical protein VK912_05555 [Longimicrobiales bacterium]|nr:hypothetical protein [Longimicrobiales bacterium]